jgi:hypothetical protein
MIYEQTVKKEPCAERKFLRCIAWRTNNGDLEEREND